MGVEQAQHLTGGPWDTPGPPPYPWPIPVSTVPQLPLDVFRCPTCDGRGILPQGFYTYPAGQSFTSSDTHWETCRTCEKSGLVVKKVDLFKPGKIGQPHITLLPAFRLGLEEPEMT